MNIRRKTRCLLTAWAHIGKYAIDAYDETPEVYQGGCFEIDLSNSVRTVYTFPIILAFSGVILVIQVVSYSYVK